MKTMKRFWVVLCLFSMAIFAMAQEESSSQLQLHSFKESRSDAGMENLGAKFIQNWPKDANGDQDCAWVRVTFENMIKADAENVTFNFGNSAPVEKKENKIEEYGEIWLWVTPTQSAIMEARLEKYGLSNRLHDLKLKPKGVYDVVLKNHKTMSINVITKPEGLQVRLVDTGEEAVTPATFTGVGLGKHRIRISENSVQKLEEDIEVTEDNVKFEYDLRKRKMVTFKSDPNHATLFLNGEKIGETPMTKELPYDSYNIEAQLGENEKDSKAFTVSDMSEDVILLEPIKKKTFSVYAMYEGRKVPADLYINGKMEDKGRPSYTLTKPIGKNYRMLMIYNGNSKQRKIKVTKDMNIEQEFKIAAKNSFTWPWQREYNVAPVGLSAGYVQKQMITEGEGAKMKNNGVWPGEGNDEWLPGVQVGLHFQPAFSFGLGLYTGLFYEFYWSKCDKNNDYSKYQEHDLYVPLHGYFRLPFTRNIALSIHGGLGMNAILHSAYSSSEDEYEELNMEQYYEQYYDNVGVQKRFNLAAELGVGFRVGPVQVNAQYSKGINDHKSYVSEGNFKTRQNKLSFSVSYMFATD